MDSRSRTVIILPPERENDLLALVQQWTAAWLIRPAIWLRSSDLVPDTAINPDAPPRAHATVIARNGSAQVELFEELGREPYELLRFVAVRSVEVGSAVNEQLDQAIDTLRQHLQASRPESTRIQYLNVIFAPTNQAGASRAHLVEMGWNRNIVVSPENRPTAESFDAFTRHSEPKRWAGFVLSHVVTVAGLWATIATSPYDEAYVDDFQEGIHLQRLSIRGVLTGRLVVSVALSAMDLAARDESPLTDPLITVEENDMRIMDEAEESEVLTDLVNTVLELMNRQLSFRGVPEAQAPKRVRVGVLREFRSVVAFGWDKFVDSPKWVVRKVKSRASRKVTEKLHGAEGDTEVDVGGILSREDAQFQSQTKAVNARRESIQQSFNDPMPALRSDVHAQLWEQLRSTCFALLDGSPLPEGSILKERLGGGPVSSVVRSVSALLPDWQVRWEPPVAVADELSRSHRIPKGPVSWLNITFAEEWTKQIDKRMTRLQARERTLRERLGRVTSELTEVSEELFDKDDELIAAQSEIAWLENDLEDHLAVLTLASLEQEEPS